MKKLLIFDLDGTLLDSLEDLADSANHVLASHGFPIHPVDAYRYFVGDGMPTLIRRILPEGQKEGEIFDTCLREFKAYYDIHMYDKTTVYPGVKEVLEELQRRGIKIAVATNKAQFAVAPLMTDYFPTITFSALIGQREGVPVKPDPQIVNDILAASNCTQEETFYLGDTAVDMQTAHRAGIEAIGLLWGYRTREELEGEHAEYIIAAPHEILDLL